MIEIDPQFQTPIPVCREMVNMVPNWCKNVLEPTPGLGNLARIINESGFNLIAVDDFFLIDQSKRYDCIVMNPPFSTKYTDTTNMPNHLNLKGMKMGYYMLTECMKMSDNVIALMPWFTLSDSDVRFRYLKKYGIKSLTGLPRKTFQYARIQTVIIELERGYKKDTIFRMFEFKDKNQLEIKLK